MQHDTASSPFGDPDPPNTHSHTLTLAPHTLTNDSDGASDEARVSLSKHSETDSMSRD
eukprot:CAMPEP_0115878472 /NCGR_PEP_ID=MMETSP0287-20121206/26787_1 /TAXON_ID=412157 /ORGANISM="Chrysochromulina rotalis, Strain UIO044" /LENGTH=57 /DNA_ID=CAMNT_0003334081 /DNA_START=67 /DNA_END=237 /DNA_ORIENTATION=+